jgi:hypothetical protein
MTATTTQSYKISASRKMPERKLMMERPEESVGAKLEKLYRELDEECQAEIEATDANPLYVDITLGVEVTCRVPTSTKLTHELPCREVVSTTHAKECGLPAMFVLWGQLYKPSQLGPRCEDHARRHVGDDVMHRSSQYAVVDLRA